MAVGDAANLYAYWGSDITDSLNAELGESGTWLLNVASQEYAKAVQLKAVHVPVVTASFPGPAVHAKQARGESA